MVANSHKKAVFMSAENCRLNQQVKSKKGPNSQKSENFSIIIGSGGGPKVFPNSKHVLLVDVYRRLVKNIVFRFLGGWNFDFSIFNPNVWEIAQIDSEPSIEKGQYSSYESGAVPDHYLDGTE